MAQEAGVSDETLVCWMDLAILSAIVVFVVPSLPWLLTRFWYQLTSTPCFILRGRPSFRISTVFFSRARPLRPLRTSNLPHLYDEKESWPEMYADSKFSSSECSYASSIWLPALDSRCTSAPVHLPSLSTILYPALTLFSRNVMGLSVGRLLIMVMLTAGCFVVSFIAGGDPFESSVRQGWIAIAFLPLTMAFGTKNNVFGMLLGMGYEKVNFLHRWLGIASFVAANIHFLGFISKWTVSDTDSPLVELRKLSNIYGLISLAGIEILFLVSLPFVRRRLYKTFLFSHIIGLALFVGFLYYHTPVTLYWIFAAAAVYGFDHTLRLIKTRFAIAQVSAIPSLGFTRIEIPSIKSGWIAGQHVRIRVLSTKVGLLGWSVAHPFTIATVPGMCGGTGMVLLVKKEGTWTRALYNLADQAADSALEKPFDSRVCVIVEGPYSGMGKMIMSSFTSAMLIGGGSGVTFVLSQAEELVRDILRSKSSVRFIDLIWITQDESSVAAMVPSFTYILSKLPTSYGVSIRISIHYTRATLVSNDRAVLSLPLSSRLVVTPGRPSVLKTLERLALSAASMQSPRGVAVGVCGPAELIRDVEKCVRDIKSHLRLACGGIEVHDESFTY